MIILKGNRNCRVCKKEIKVYIEKFSGHPTLIGKGTKSIIQSHEGVLFNKNVWFCNSCFNEIMEGIKYEKEKN